MTYCRCDEGARDVSVDKTPGGTFFVTRFSVRMFGSIGDDTVGARPQFGSAQVLGRVFGKFGE